MIKGVTEVIEIWGKPQCPYCEKAKLLCDMREIEFTYKQLGEDFTREELFEVFPEAKTFPQIRTKDKYIGGYKDLEKILGNMLT